MLTFSYWMTEATNAEFLLYVGSENLVVWDLLPTLPTVYMLIEFPFNMIPIDWPMLAFVELQFLIYLFINFLVVTCEADHNNTYEAFDWYEQTGEAFGYMLACMCLLAGVFALLWVVS